MNGDALVKKTTKIMFGDAGVSGTAQYMSQLVWVLFLKVFDYKEEEWELEDNYTPVIPKPFRFRDWADPRKDDGTKDYSNRMTGDKLINFVNNTLFPYLRGVEIEYNGKKLLFNSEDSKSLIIRSFMSESQNYMKDGVKLRQLINEIGDIDFDIASQKHDFNDFYERLLKELQNGGKATGEFYTPRALTQFIVDHVNPQIGESIADFACGTGGFLADAVSHLQKQAKSVDDAETIQNSIYGIEWKQLPYMLCVTNMYLHNIDNPRIIHGDGLAKDVLDLSDDDLYNCIIMNPPFGGEFNKLDLKNFPDEIASAESADLFVARIIYCLKKNGRCGLVLPDSLFINTDQSKTNLKRLLMTECNLHTIIRLPSSVFAPYTGINTNLLFFDKTGTTKEVWFYRMDMPEGRLHFNKTHPITREDLFIVDKWWDNRKEIKDVKEDPSSPDTWKAKKYSLKELEDLDFNLDLCGFPKEEEIVLSPEEVIEEFKEKLNQRFNEINKITENITAVLSGGKISKQVKSLSNECNCLSVMTDSFTDDIRRSILLYAMQGKLTDQKQKDGEASELFSRIQKEKAKLEKEKLIKKSKPLPEISDDEIPYDIPDNWKWVRFGDIVDFRLGKTPPRVDAKSWGNDYKWVSISDMNSNGYITETKESVSEYGFSKSFGSKISPKGTLLMSFKLTIGCVSILDIDAVHNEAIISIFPIIDDEHIMRDYLFKILPCVAKTGNSKKAIKGNTLNSTSISNLMIPLPPLVEQKRIVKKLDTVLPMLDVM